MLFSVAFPLIRSFENRIAYYQSFKPLFFGIALIGSFFIIWDIIFTELGFWGFNQKYLSGIYLVNLPLGEWLFFIIIPFCSVFIYRVMNYFVERDIFGPYKDNIGRFLYGFSLATAAIFHDRWYTFLTFILLGLLLIYHTEVWKTKWIGRFYLAYLVVLIPFFIVNGILTGFGLKEEIVWYNDMENMGIRLLTIPFEDAFYGMVLILGVTSVYEYMGSYWNMKFAQDRETE